MKIKKNTKIEIISGWKISNSYYLQKIAAAAKVIHVYYLTNYF